jgi:peptidyl-prolyl cis-trans isomerase B (cyclophilin B)
MKFSGLVLLIGVWNVTHVTTAQDDRPVVVLETSRGNIVLELRPDRAPKTVEHFLGLVRSGYYDEMLFHRIVPSAVIQVGVLSMEAEVRGLEVSPVENESRNRLRNDRGTVAMARAGDPHSATTEFFVNVRDNRELDYVRSPERRWGFAVFGRVIEGMEVVDDIAGIPTKELGPFPNFPAEPVGIYRAYVRE